MHRRVDYAADHAENPGLYRPGLWVFTAGTFALALVLNGVFPRAALWMLFIVPMVGLIVLYPKWLVGHLSGLGMAAIRLGVEFEAFGGRIPPQFLERLVTTSLVAWFIFLTVTYVAIRIDRLVQELERRSLTDELTRVPNRRSLEIEARRLLAHAAETGQPLILLMLDLDHFKGINDRLGHNAGDAVLQRVARELRGQFQGRGILARMGGEEFAVLLTNTALDDGMREAEVLRAMIERTLFHYRGEPISVTVSVGVSQFAEETLEDLVRKSDRALYQAKESGRNRVVSYQTL